ncbi:hypothetical protein GDO81_017946 [Engystomops pustulosus]|uniref:Uncharacterized protein n=1 Tax=Engystomops pustulosus TaxID=76066 RepID=A0AAV7A8C6_ENGPU|nr:hypothetical protein GDO81_017946 [Engystomops pustulosus]
MKKIERSVVSCILGLVLTTRMKDCKPSTLTYWCVPLLAESSLSSFSFLCPGIFSTNKRLLNYANEPEGLQAPQVLIEPGAPKAHLGPNTPLFCYLATYKNVIKSDQKVVQSPK